MTYPAINASKSSHSFAVGRLFDVDGIKTSFATSTSIVTLDEAADFDGAEMVSAALRFKDDVARAITMTLASNAGSYVASAITLTYKRGGVQYTATATPTGTDGGETIRFVDASGKIVLVDEIVSIVIPAQTDTNGSFEIGVEDIAPKNGDTWHACELHAAGNMALQYPGGHQDVIPFTSGNQLRVVGAERILTNQSLSSPTNVGVTGYWG